MNKETDIQTRNNEGACSRSATGSETPGGGDEGQWVSDAKLACNALVWQWGQETLTLAQADALSHEILELLITRRGGRESQNDERSGGMSAAVTGSPAL